MRRLCGAAACIALLAFHAEAQAAHALTAAQNYYHGRYLEAANRMPEAAVHYSEVIRVSSGEIARNAATRESFVLLTRALRRMNRHAEVISWGQQGLRAFPDEFRLLETMGQSFFFMGDFEQSLSHMERYANAMPNGDRISLAYFFIGEIMRLSQRFYRAELAYAKAVHFAPNMALWWYRLGSMREQVGDAAPALAAYRRALELSPNHAAARAGLARLAAAE